MFINEFTYKMTEKLEKEKMKETNIDGKEKLRK
jgi:hypothetical protein